MASSVQSGPSQDEVHAHRGASAVAPENTLAAFKAASEQGAQWVEFDVALLADGTPVVIHDDKIDRCSFSKGFLGDLTLADLADIDVGSWFGTSFKGEPIPTLAQVIETLGQLGLSANVEIKQHKHHKSLEQLTETVHAHLQRRSPQTRIVISSFDAEALKGMYRLEPSYDLAMLWSELPANWAELLEAIPAKTIHINYKALSIGFLEEAKRRGVLVRAWTCNTPELLASFWKAGLTGVITDDPRVFLT